MATEIRPRDAYGALRWLQQQSDVQKDKIAIMGWSHGGSTLLSAIRQDPPLSLSEFPTDFKTAIAFYPGCDGAEKNKRWSNRIPLEILMGELDNWTSPEKCKSLVDRVGGSTKIILYPESYHDFDAPNMRVRVKKNLAYVVRPDHSATIGTNEKARGEAIQRVSEILKTALE